jgi:nucleoside-diphosphate-sugar epimerase
MPLSTDLVFITGATGYIGSTVALRTLQAGYQVRLTVRKEAQIDELKALYAEFASEVVYVIVTDFTTKDAFAGLLTNLTHILHAASPLAVSTVPEEVILPAVQGTLNILEEARRVKSVRKVVITSSISALMPIGGAPAVLDGVVVRG